MKNRKWWSVAIVLILVVIGGYGISFFKSINKTIDTINEPIQRIKSDKRAIEVALDKKDPFSVLVLGVDERARDKGRSDTMIVLTVNPNQNSIKMLSIPRDTRTEIIGN